MSIQVTIQFRHKERKKERKKKRKSETPHHGEAEEKIKKKKDQQPVSQDPIAVESAVYINLGRGREG